ncbi:hypothetical protein [Cellulomonas sp. NPDC089187]|uniref:TY-Chap domain-containing protein n=1 Tax=Cellulomonas sp. NPDC089187 TaxID=3154970 RepID=UPI00342FAE7D
MTTWEDWAGYVADCLMQLGNGDALVVRAVGVPTRSVLDRRSRLGELIPERRRDDVPFFQFLHMGEAIRGELVGDPSIGGRFPWTPEERGQILALGWQDPTGDPFFAEHYRRLWPTQHGVIDGAEAAGIAAVAARTADEVLGCESPAALHTQVVRGAAS